MVSRGGVGSHVLALLFHHCSPSLYPLHVALHTPMAAITTEVMCTCSFNNPEDPELGGFFDKYGFAVISNVLSAEECSETIDELWK